MTRSMWNGSIGWGMVNVPIKLYAATEEHDLKFHQVHAHDHGRIRYHKVCEACDERIHQADIAKMFESEDGREAYLTDEDFAELASESSKQVEVLEFVSAEDVNPLLLDKPYFAAPESPAAAKSYALLAKALTQTNRVAVTRLTLRSKTHLAVLRTTEKGEVLVIQTLRWPDELRQPEFDAKSITALTRQRAKISDAELSMALTLVDDMSNEWNPDRYQDTYKVELSELIESRLTDTPEIEKATEDVSDLLADLEATAKAKKRRKAKVPA